LIPAAQGLCNGDIQKRAAKYAKALRKKRRTVHG
jgi:hypothetical protein